MQTVTNTNNGSFQQIILTCVLTLIAYGFFFFSFLGLHLQHIEVSRLGVKSEWQLLAYTTATAMPDVNCICDLPHAHSNA